MGHGKNTIEVWIVPSWNRSVLPRLRILSRCLFYSCLVDWFLYNFHNSFSFISCIWVQQQLISIKLVHNLFNRPNTLVNKAVGTRFNNSTLITSESAVLMPIKYFKLPIIFLKRHTGSVVTSYCQCKYLFSVGPEVLKELFPFFTCNMT